ncbi:MAG: transglycosylase domain-containing protein [Rhodospirillaceae bacterium]
MLFRAPVKLRTISFAFAGIVAVGAGIAVLEAQSSYLQANFLTKRAQNMAYAVQPGPAPDAQFPATGPYDERLGYTAIPSFVERLTDKGFTVDQQAAPSEQMHAFVADGGYAVYREKNQAGLKIVDRSGQPVYAKSFPQWVYSDFETVPRLMADTLLFIEDRELLNDRFDRRNPAVSWSRFAGAAASRVPGLSEFIPVRGGASTLATQIEKFRHSPGGRTGSAGEKLTQMLTASMRAYMDGPDTTAARQRILVTYLNSTPLGSRAGYGEIIGIADGLAAWFGTDFKEANRVLTGTPRTDTERARKAEIYKQVLSLLLAQRRPAYYLGSDHAALEKLSNRYLAALKASGLIDAGLHKTARAAKLKFTKTPPAPPPVSFTERKAADLIRTELLNALRVPGYYSLDRMDMTVHSTIDRTAQRDVVRVLDRLDERDYVKSLGMTGENLLGNSDPSKVAYSVVLYERGEDHHTVRVHADSLNKPFNLNSGGKLILGSTAKLRTTATYLNIIAALHEKYEGMPRKNLAAAVEAGADPLTAWSVDYLLTAKDTSLQAMLDAAMQRTYSASPYETFFTGGGAHNFNNFNKDDNAKIPTLEYALRHSINLPFIRLMRDITRYHLAMDKEEFDDADPARSRAAYLRRFADREGREYLSRFYDDYKDATPDAALENLASHTRAKPHSLAVVFRSVRPLASAGEFGEFLRARLNTPLDKKDIQALYTKYAIDRFSLQDRGYIAGVHPLELWMVSYLQSHPHASWSEYTAASTYQRQEIYGWLFKTNHKHRQDSRIRILKEEEAFNRVLKDWRAQGYPFAQIIPSYATAIGSSGDRPDALARLMGIILNDGLDAPITNVERIAFAGATPFETELGYAAPKAPTRVFAPEVARTLKRVLASVVDGGTAIRLHNTFRTPDGAPLSVGGKTGTGDNRYKTFGAGGNVIESRAVDRTSTFVFFLGDRFFGTITAYVPGEDADNYSFTSALALQLLKGIAPTVQRLIDSPVEQQQLAVHSLTPMQEARVTTPLQGVAVGPLTASIER